MLLFAFHRGTLVTSHPLCMSVVFLYAAKVANYVLKAPPNKNAVRMWRDLC